MYKVVMFEGWNKPDVDTGLAYDSSLDAIDAAIELNERTGDKGLFGVRNEKTSEIEF